MFAVAAQQACAQWIDTKTGEVVPSGPILATKTGYPDGSGVRPGVEGGKREGIPPDLSDRNRAYDPVSGRNFFFDSVTCQWKDAKTGKVVPSGPILATKTGYADGSGVRPGIEGGKREGISPDPSERDRAYDPVSGRNFARILCPPQKPRTTEQPSTGSQVGSVPPVKLDKFEQRILDVHNAERVAIGVPALRWNPALEATATAYAAELARTGQLVHAPREGRGIERENLSQGMLGWNTDEMLRNWLNEKRYFIPGIYPNVTTAGDWSSVSHYSQMIWPTTIDLGCGMASGSGFQWLVCRYSPGGNKDGKPVGQPGLAGSSVATQGEHPKPVRYQWIDVKTGRQVASWPSIDGRVIRGGPGDPNRAFDPETGRNFARDESGNWIDTKTGKRVADWPSIDGRVIRGGPGDPDRAFDPETGRNFAKEPVSTQPVRQPERG